MKNRYITGIILVFVGILALNCSVFASSGPGIRIDGNLRVFSPAAQIVNNRTMVPIRFIMEDEALQGKVFWNNEERKVTIDCRGKHIEFIIGSQEALVDEQLEYFDTAPYIYRDRTFVPLRFLAENMGATVSWKSQQREVCIDFNYKPRVFAYYYYRSFDELQENAALFSDVAFRWFACNGQGELFYEYQDNYAPILQFTRDKGIKNHASVVLMGKEVLHELLASPDNRQRLIGNLLDEVKRNKYDGVNIDFEFIDPEDADLFTAFLQELKTYLGPEKSLSVAVFARTGQESWPSPYNYKEIGEIADVVVIMAYDYSYKNTAPGPIAPIWWVEDVLEYACDNIPAEKILLGIPTYGYNWASGLATTTITGDELEKIMTSYELKEGFDQRSMSPYYYYVDDKKVIHHIWMENEISLSEKLALVREKRIAGISFWRIGNGFDDLYEVLGK